MRAFAEIARRPRLADEVGCCGGCTDDDPEDDGTTPTYGPAVEPATPDSGLQLGANSLSSEATNSHLKAALLDVVELQAEGLYAAEDSPLVTEQTDPDAPDVTGETSSDTHNQGSTGNLVFLEDGVWRDSLYAHGGDGIQGCVARGEEVVLVLAHLDGVQPVADGDEERVVGQVIRGLGETAGRCKDRGEEAEGDRTTEG